MLHVWSRDLLIRIAWGIYKMIDSWASPRLSIFFFFNWRISLTYRI